jgi:arginase
MPLSFTVLGAPTSAGAHHAGLELTPAALRGRGLIEKLWAAGLDVEDAGDVAGATFARDASSTEFRNLGAVVRVAAVVADAVAGIGARGRIPIVLGGDCTVSVGLVAGLQRVHPAVRVAYFDGDADLPSTGGGSGILDATGVAHLLGLLDSPLGRLGPHSPMLAPSDLVLLGFDPDDPDSCAPDVLAGLPDLRRFDYRALRGDPEGVAVAAARAASATGAAVAVHFDVDSIDSADLPLANYPHYGTGVSVATARLVLGELLRAPGFAGLSLTEVNTTHDPSGAELDRYLDLVVGALAEAVSGR